MDGIHPGTKKLTTRAALDDYIADFNVDDFPRYCAYYAKDVIVSVPNWLLHHFSILALELCIVTAWGFD